MACFGKRSHAWKENSAEVLLILTSIAIPAPVKTAPSVLGCDRFLLAGEATNQKKGHGCVKIDTPWPFSILILRDARAPKRRAILKPFCDAIWGPGQASNPRQSRESQPFVRLPPLYSPFSSIVTPYIQLFAQRCHEYPQGREVLIQRASPHGFQDVFVRQDLADIAGQKA